MSESEPSKKLQELLTVTFADITMHARENMLPTAEKNFYSTRDYALGDFVACNGTTALENCEQIKSCFPRDAPPSVLKNIEAVQAQIRRMENARRPFLAGKLWIIIIFAAIAFFIYFVISHHGRFAQ